MILKARIPTGQFWPKASDAATSNLVTTRILWLEGLQPGFNSGAGVDSYARFIYIHGTNREDALGSQISGGCVLLRDSEVVRLYAETPVGSHVYLA
jgi:lipoprotein-anchoring transpeptidase ErfK/SrfK